MNALAKFILGMLAALACVPSAAAMQDETAGAALTTSVAAQDYQLGPGDKTRIIIFNEPSLSGEFVVSATGSLSLPLIGDVRAANRTSAQITSEIQARYADGYLRDPQVSMDILTYRPFYIMGEVGKPGEYPYSSGLTVLNAVATAQGFTYRANKRKVFIKRAGTQEEVRHPLTPDLRIQPGDTVRIGERYF